MSNGTEEIGLHERFFKLWAKVSMMCVDRKRYPYYLYDTLTKYLKLPAYDPNKQEGLLYRMLVTAQSVAIVSDENLRAATDALQEVLTGPTPVFVVMESQKLTIQHHYFVGTSLEDILANTENGTRYTFHTITSYKVVEVEQVILLNFRFFDKSVEAVRKGCYSYWLGTREKM